MCSVHLLVAPKGPPELASNGHPLDRGTVAAQVQGRPCTRNGTLATLAHIADLGVPRGEGTLATLCYKLPLRQSDYTQGRPIQKGSLEALSNISIASLQRRGWGEGYPCDLVGSGPWAATWGACQSHAAATLKW